MWPYLERGPLLIKMRSRWRKTAPNTHDCVLSGGKRGHRHTGSDAATAKGPPSQQRGDHPSPAPSGGAGPCQHPISDSPPPNGRVCFSAGDASSVCRERGGGEDVGHPACRPLSVELWLCPGPAGASRSFSAKQTPRQLAPLPWRWHPSGTAQRQLAGVRGEPTPQPCLGAGHQTKRPRLWAREGRSRRKSPLQQRENLPGRQEKTLVFSPSRVS